VRKFKTILAVVGLPFALTVMGLLGSTLPAQAQVTNTCAMFQTINTTGTPSYYVQTNYWNSTTCPTTQQCMTINNVTGDFTVTGGDFACGDTVANYPSIVYGCQSEGNCSIGTNLPIEVSALTCVTSSWNIAVTNETGSDLWDAAYDIWFTTSTGSGLNTHSAELMIWLNYMPGTGPAGSEQADGVTIGNTTTTWRVNEGPTGGSPGWNYIAFMADTNITSFNDANILAFINYCVSQGYIQSTWYLSAIEAGIEMRTGGVPFSSTGFSASVNSPSCGTPTVTSSPTPTQTFTPTITNTPCGYPGNTCTPTFTPTLTATPSNFFTAFPNPWPNLQYPGPTISFYYQNDQTEDAVQLKIFTLSFRKIYEDDTLRTSQGPQPPEVVNVANLNLANGLYYFVLVTKSGGHQNQKVMKVLIRR
jgi:hypothetical protein